jgi:predicted transcriptional regulator
MPLSGGKCMFNNRRSEMQIIKEILESSKDGIKTTQLLYNCGLKHSQLKEYVSFLIEKNIIRENKVKNGSGCNVVYSVTPKGKAFLVDIDKAFSYLE